MIKREIHFGAFHMNIEVGNLYQIINGYYSDLPDNKVSLGGAWVNDPHDNPHFIPEGTIGLIIKQYPKYCNLWETLIGDKIFIVNEHYLKEL
jgi:hypothetical protein